MAVVFFLLLLASVLGLVLGLINPRLVLYWGQKRSRKMASLTYGIATVIFFFAIGATGPSTHGTVPLHPNQGTGKAVVGSNSTNNTLAGQENKATNTNPPVSNVASRNVTGSKNSSQITNTANSNTSVGVKNSTTQPNVCRTDWSAGVYHTYRFNLLNRCKTVSGTVEIVRHEADHDYHLDIKLDSQYNSLLANGNYKYQHGYLVVEVIPMDQPYVSIPTVGQHATFTGAVVDDKDHNWNEVHPAWLVNGNGKSATLLQPLDSL